MAYKNEEFLDSPDARPLRILSEYLEPLAHFRREKIRDTVVFFGSARIQRRRARWATTTATRATLARLVTEWSDQFANTTHRFVVCTGGGPGHHGGRQPRGA